MDVRGTIDHKHCLPLSPWLIMAGLQAMISHGEFALVHDLAAPISDHVSIDIGQTGVLAWRQDRHQRRRCINALKLTQKLTQRGRVIAGANERLEGMLLDIKATEPFNPQQRGQHQGVKTAPQGRLTCNKAKSSPGCVR